MINYSGISIFKGIIQLRSECVHDTADLPTVYFSFLFLQINNQVVGQVFGVGALGCTQYEGTMAPF